MFIVTHACAPMNYYVKRNFYANTLRGYACEQTISQIKQLIYKKISQINTLRLNVSNYTL